MIGLEDTTSVAANLDNEAFISLIPNQPTSLALIAKGWVMELQCEIQRKRFEHKCGTDQATRSKPETVKLRVH